MISYKKFTELHNEEIKFLDTLDLKEAIKTHSDVYDLMNYIEETYGKDYKLESFIFNCTSTDDFIDYLSRRYDINVTEIIKYEITINE